MKKVLAMLAGVAAVTGAVLYLNNKKKKNTLLVSQEFEEAPSEESTAETEEPAEK